MAVSYLPTVIFSNFALHLAAKNDGDITVLTAEEGDAFVANNIKAAAKVVDAVQKKAPTMGTSIAKYKKEKAAWQAELDQAQNTLDYWNGVKDAQEAEVKRVNDEKRAAEEQANRETRNYNHGAEDSYARGYNEQDPDARMRAEVLLDTSKRVLTDAGFNPETENVSETITQMVKEGKSADRGGPHKQTGRVERL